MDEREFGRLEQKVESLPTHESLGAVRAEALTAMDRVSSRLEKLFEKHEAKTAENIEKTVRDTVDAAFKLQWAKMEKEIADQIADKVPEPKKRDWVPYIAIAGVIVYAGVERAIPIITKLLGF
ncbi:MAG: hypothetical protein AAGA72_18210 [Pseudomonadota bacterium]